MSKLYNNSNSEFEIHAASLKHLDKLSRLFEGYRAFYQMPQAPESTKQFLKERFDKRDSIILVAFQENLAAGFCQVYPIYSSVAMKPVWILNDLFVSEKFRSLGVAKSLIAEVEIVARKHGVFSIKLATAIDNKKAQALYEKQGYSRISTFEHFSKKL